MLTEPYEITSLETDNQVQMFVGSRGMIHIVTRRMRGECDAN